MKPATGKMEKIMGTTHDGINMFESDGYRLVFTIADFSRDSWNQVYFAVERNTNEFGKKLPYYVLSLPGFSVTGGWLFEHSGKEGA